MYEPNYWLFSFPKLQLCMQQTSSFCPQNDTQWLITFHHSASQCSLKLLLPSTIDFISKNTLAMKKQTFATQMCHQKICQVAWQRHMEADMKAPMAGWCSTTRCMMPMSNKIYHTTALDKRFLAHTHTHTPTHTHTHTHKCTDMKVT
jgi:hypothetical protein